METEMHHHVCWIGTNHKKSVVNPKRPCFFELHLNGFYWAPHSVPMVHISTHWHCLLPVWSIVNNDRIRYLHHDDHKDIITKKSAVSSSTTFSSHTKIHDNDMWCWWCPQFPNSQKIIDPSFFDYTSSTFLHIVDLQWVNK